MSYDKADAARRQLGTALQLFIDDRDPVSVHCLACGGVELAEHLVAKTEHPPFALHALETFPDLDRRKLVEIRNRYWNAFKHATKTGGGAERNDGDLLAAFTDEVNDHLLFTGWFDYGRAVGCMPIEAQAFQAWYFAKFPEKAREDVDLEPYDRLFPSVLSLPRNKQKAMLRRVIARARLNREVMSDPRTDRRALILRA